jgi:hypothetical protein
MSKSNTFKIKYFSLAVLVASLFVGSIGVSMAQAFHGTVEIRAIGTGWGQDQFLIYTVGDIPAQMYASNNCTARDGYFAKIDYAGYKTHFSVVQLAFALGKPVNVTVSNVVNDCIDGRPRIIGLQLVK